MLYTSAILERQQSWNLTEIEHKAEIRKQLEYFNIVG